MHVKNLIGKHIRLTADAKKYGYFRRLFAYKAGVSHRILQRETEVSGVTTAFPIIF